MEWVYALIFVVAVLLISGWVGTKLGKMWDEWKKLGGH